MKTYYLPDANQLPAPLKQEAEGRWYAFIQAAVEAGFDPSSAAHLKDQGLRVFAFSEFAANLCASNPALLCDSKISSSLHTPYYPDTWSSLISDTEGQQQNNLDDDTGLGTFLRRLRHREMLRIAWRDLTGLADLSETITDLSLLAETCLSHTCTAIHSWLTEEYGHPLDGNGAPQELVTIAMGKLGARELNFSSDIDLIFAFPEHGTTSGGSRGKLSCQQFFTRLCQRLMAVIGTNRADGFVFRVDTRLRPWGDTGPICMSFDAMEEYYEVQGREWERYAWIKARPVTGSRQTGKELMKRLSPFVFRRYLDFGAFEALRDMKGMIETETRRKGMESNIKLGPGGIREVEFIAQAFQLLKGGRDVELQNPRLMEVLPLLGKRNILDDKLCERLLEAYTFLRNLEHRLQEHRDRQTQMLPDSEEMLARIGLSMGFTDLDLFIKALDCHRKCISSTFNELFIIQSDTPEDDAVKQAWQAVKNGGYKNQEGHFEKDFLHLLARAGVPEPLDAARLLDDFIQNRAIEAMHEQGLRRLDSLMPKVIRQAAATDEPVRALCIMTDIIKVVARRTVYISLLDENPAAITHMLRLCMASPWIASFIKKRPVVFDELIDPRALYSPLKGAELKTLLDMRMGSIDNDDLEAEMDELRMFKQAAVIRIAAADITGAIPTMRVSDFLTETAQVITDKVLELSFNQIIRKFSKETTLYNKDKTGFLIVAYGKFGGIELGYGSDLDMLFVHMANRNGPVASDQLPVFYARLGQRIIHILSTRTASGILYETDMRLRPGGDSGPLACSIKRLEEYLKKEAWTWELQALIRARPVSGDPGLATDFNTLRTDILCQKRDREKLRCEVKKMRERMLKAHATAERDVFNLKHHRGGIVDIEFMVQYLVLANAHSHPELCKWTDNMRLIDTLEAAGLLPETDADTMRSAYLAFRSAVHRQSLQERPPEVPVQDFISEIEGTRQLWDRIMG